MGVVYEAVDMNSGVTVALKTVRAPTPDALARFKREFRVMQDLHHPNLIQLGELVSDADDCFFTMELVEGTDFLSYVRGEQTAAALQETLRVDDDPSATLDPTTASMDALRAAGATHSRLESEARLRSSFRQLAAGVAALHAAGVVHRDIKPTNVRVTPEGRVVILDLGLASMVDSDHHSTRHNAVGTPAYMAPEQAASRAPGTEADWYSVGVMLYEALTGRLPFDGAPLAILMAKQQHEPPAPSRLAPGLPEDLDRLCVALLRIDPGVRAGGLDVSKTFAVPADGPSRPSHSLTISGTFVGRQAEMAVLREAFADSRRGEPRAVFIQGESGMGKSCLVRHFTDGLATIDPRVLVLAGRCYEREAVPYKAFDGIVDALAHFLKYARAEEVAALQPTRPGPLVQIFPVLRRVTSIMDLLSRGQKDALDPIELRTRAFGALRELFTRLADRHPLVLVVEDIQWADADSLALLFEVLRPPDAPGLLLVATERSTREADGGSAAQRMVGPALRTIRIAPLSGAESADLARTLMSRGAPDGGADADAIAAESEGHPLFIDALVRHSSVALGNDVRGLRLEDALWSLVMTLDERRRDIAQLLSIAGAPLRQETLASAVGVSRGELAPSIASLRVAHLATLSGGRGDDVVEAYHDRVRSAVLAHMSDEARRSAHRRLALALETTGSLDAEALSRHWLGAGERVLAARYAVSAGNDAAGALAFDRAATLYELALGLDDTGSSDDRRELQTKLGDALANAGRGARAAAAFQKAVAGASAATALELRRRAAEQLLTSGHFDEGMQAVRAVLTMVGLRFPSTTWRALALAFVLRAFLRLRGLSFHVRDPSQIAADRLMRIDVCWSVSIGLSLIDHIRSTGFQARHLLLALQAGESRRVLRALAMHVGFLGTGGTRTWTRTTAVMAKAEMMLATLKSAPYETAMLRCGFGFAQTSSGRYVESIETLEEAERMFQSECSGVAFELVSARHFIFICLARLGRLADIARRQHIFVREAVERGNLYGTVILRIGHANIAWLVADDPERAREDVTDAIRSWSTSGFHLEHYYELLALTYVDLYAGRGAKAYERVLARWSGFRRSLLHTIQGLAIESAEFRGRSALAAAEAPGAGRRRLLGAALRDARAIERQGAAWGLPIAALLRAGAAQVSEPGDPRVISLLRRAVAGFDEGSMALPAAAARRFLGPLVGGDEGREITGRALAWMASQGVKNPDRLASMVAPGFGALL